MNENSEIRRAVPGDAPSIQKCVKAAYRQYIERIGKPPGPMLDDYEDVIRRHSVFVATGNDVVGVLVLMRSETGMLLDNVAVHPDHQGAGLGKRLIGFAESEALEQGYKVLTLYTHECMTENIGLYRALGYEITTRKEERGYRRVYMQKSLTRK